MGNDIAEWLRDSAPPGPLGKRMVEAAAEIARLRAALEEIAREWITPMPLGTPDKDRARRWMEHSYHLQDMARTAAALPPLA